MPLAAREIDVSPSEPRGAILRAISMHGTSPFRRESARLLGALVEATGAEAAAYGWRDALAPTLVVPVHVVSRVGPVAWRTARAGVTEVEVEADGDMAWVVALVRAETMPSPAMVGRVSGWFTGARFRDVPCAHEGVARGAARDFLARLDAYRTVAFQTGRPEHVEVLRDGLAAGARALPIATRSAATRVVESFGDVQAFGQALLALGEALDLAGALAEAVSVEAIAYEAALHRGDASLGIDAARWAGRGHRKLGEWDAAFRWYGLAREIAEQEGDLYRLAVVLDGEGNTYRQKGAVGRARERYERAWDIATSSGDPRALGAVGHSMMIVERGAGRLEEAAGYGLAAIRAQPDRERRARLLIDLGTLWVDGGDAATGRRAYRLAGALTRDDDMRALALDAVAYTYALEGDGKRYHSVVRSARPEARSASMRIRAQMGFYRGRSLWLFGRSGDATRVLAATERMARAAGLDMWSVEAGELADAIRAGASPPVPAQHVASEGVREGIAELEAEVGV